MDAIRFDALTRALGEGTTRRGVTRLLAGLTLGGLTLGGLVRPLSGHAKKRGHGKGKTKAKGQSRGKDEEKKDQLGAARKARRACRAPGASCSRNAQCCSSKCSGGTCRCTTASQCPQPGPCQTRTCTAGRCTLQPAPQGTACGDGDACTDGSRCDGQGQCVAGTSKDCPDGKVCDRQDGCVCDGTRCSDACPCSGNQVCQAGQCGCHDGTEQCANSCVDTQVDPDHCGACGAACEGGTGTCRGGVCATPEVCDNADNDFDGEIDEGARCPGNQVCQGGACGCPAGTRDCDGDDTCEQLGTDQHCAGCAPCAGGQVCDGGECGCPAGTQNCDGSCEQLGTDQHCADCNDTCTGGRICQGGSCVTPAVCGNGTCDPGETCSTCPGDCGACPGTACTTDTDCVPATCCHPSSCVPRAQGPRFCGGACSGECKAYTMDCGQGHCACLSGECVAVSDPWCGDLECNGGEDCLSCPDDCGPCPFCGDGVCNGSETCSTCPEDCGACPGTECTTGTDCVPATCCHPSSCVPLAQQPLCNGVACSGECKEFTMDCGQGFCGCLSGECVALGTVPA